MSTSQTTLVRIVARDIAPTSGTVSRSGGLGVMGQHGRRPLSVLPCSPALAVRSAGASGILLRLGTSRPHLRSRDEKL